jgi:hypothetical protein
VHLCTDTRLCTRYGPGVAARRRTGEHGIEIPGGPGIVVSSKLGAGDSGSQVDSVTGERHAGCMVDSPDGKRCSFADRVLSRCGAVVPLVLFARHGQFSRAVAVASSHDAESWPFTRGRRDRGSFRSVQRTGDGERNRLARGHVALATSGGRMTQRPPTLLSTTRAIGCSAPATKMSRPRARPRESPRSRQVRVDPRVRPRAPRTRHAHRPSSETAKAVAKPPRKPPRGTDRGCRSQSDGALRLLPVRRGGWEGSVVACGASPAGAVEKQRRPATARDRDQNYRTVRFRPTRAQHSA